MSRLMKVSFKLLDLLVIFMMVFGSPMSAAAKVWTEPSDSTPGGTVIIYGNNEDDTLDQNWVAGETVTVVAIAPDGVYTDEFTSLRCPPSQTSALDRSPTSNKKSLPRGENNSPLRKASWPSVNLPSRAGLKQRYIH